MGDETSFDYERSDIESADIAWLATGLAIFIVVVPLVMPLVFPQSMRHPTPSAPPVLSADAPALEIRPRENLRRFSRSEADRLNGYGWADRSHGVVRIPVRRAMELLTQRGLPGWPSP
jgi:hypothetical protein